MKTLTAILLFISLILPLTAAPEFGSAVERFKKAYQVADHGTYHIYGNGLEESYYFDVEYEGVENREQLMSPFDGRAFLLEFSNYKSFVQETALILDRDGVVLFESNSSWKPIESISQKAGPSLEYTLPGHVGMIRFYLADQLVPFDGDSAHVQLVNGYAVTLEVSKGNVIVPGWIWEQEGTFVTFTDGEQEVTDIQTGLPVHRGFHMIQLEPTAIEGLEVVEAWKGTSYLDIYAPHNQWHKPVYEFTSISTRSYRVHVYDDRGMTPSMIQYTFTDDDSGSGPDWITPNENGEFRIHVPAGKTIHLLPYWNHGQGGKN